RPVPAGSVGTVETREVDTPAEPALATLGGVQRQFRLADGGRTGHDHDRSIGVDYFLDQCLDRLAPAEEVGGDGEVTRAGASRRRIPLGRRSGRSGVG